MFCLCDKKIVKKKVLYLEQLTSQYVGWKYVIIFQNFAHTYDWNVDG